MNLYCTRCQTATSHTDEIAFGYAAPGIMICKQCASRNYHPSSHARPTKQAYFIKPHPTIDEAIRLYRQRGVKHPERLFPGWLGETRITLDAFVQQMTTWSYQLFKADPLIMIEWFGNPYGHVASEVNVGRVRVSAEGIPQPGFIDKALTEELDQCFGAIIATLIPGNKKSEEIVGYVAMQH